jgi:hypothetical protein
VACAILSSERLMSTSGGWGESDGEDLEVMLDTIKVVPVACAILSRERLMSTSGGWGRAMEKIWRLCWRERARTSFSSPRDREVTPPREITMITAP